MHAVTNARVAVAVRDAAIDEYIRMREQGSDGWALLCQAVGTVRAHNRALGAAVKAREAGALTSWWACSICECSPCQCRARVEQLLDILGPAA